MTNPYKVYTKILRVLKEMIKLSHLGQLTLAMMILGLVTNWKSQLPVVSAEVEVAARA